jgi:hypothetical protein
MFKVTKIEKSMWIKFETASTSAWYIQSFFKRNGVMSFRKDSATPLKRKIMKHG